MPAELTTTARYPCEHAGCTRRFGWKAAREQHYHEAHATSRNPLDAFPTISEALSKDDNYRDLESLKSENLSDDSQASSEATKAELKLKCTYVDCDQLFSSEEDMIKHKIDASEHD